MFIGYPRSRHSLVGAILDAHPEIIIPHEYDVLARWKEYQSSDFKNKNLKKYVLFFNLHKLSTEQAMFGGNRANNKGFYNYNVPGLWQGGYEKKIQVFMIAALIYDLDRLCTHCGPMTLNNDFMQLVWYITSSSCYRNWS